MRRRHSPRFFPGLLILALFYEGLGSVKPDPSRICQACGARVPAGYRREAACRRFVREARSLFWSSPLSNEKICCCIFFETKAER